MSRYSASLIARLGILTMAAMAPVGYGAARASVPACAEHMQEPPEGGVLSPAQIAINSSCLATLAAFQKVAEMRAKIDEEDHREKKAAHPGSNLSSPGAPLPAPPAPFDAPAPAPSPAPQAEDPLPRVAQILDDNTGKPTATLRLPGGGMIDVSRAGRGLPGGLIVEKITSDTVFVRKGTALLPLPTDDGSVASTAPTPFGSSNAAIPLVPGRFQSIRPTGGMR